MRFEWHIEEKDVHVVKALYERMQSNNVVQERFARNINEEHRSEFSQETFWFAHVACLLTTQQRSGPYSAVNKLIIKKPFPLSLQQCRRHSELESFFSRIFSEHGGIRRGKRITKHAENNLKWLEKEGWQKIDEIVKNLVINNTAKNERAAAKKIGDWFDGFGPKQSRNLLQMLGLTRYEIPLDSRVTKWLNSNGFPIRLTASALGDEAYYEFVMDAVQELCNKAGLFPCIFDAMVFASFDNEVWTENNLMW